MNALPDCCRETPGGVELRVRVAPRSSRDAVLDVREGRIRIALTAPPVDGEANAGLRAYLARLMGVAKGNVQLTHGERGREKTVLITAVSLPDAITRLGLA